MTKKKTKSKKTKSKKLKKPEWASTRGNAPVIEKPGPEKTPPTVTPYPTAGRKVTEFESLLDEQLAGGPAEGKPGRPKQRDPLNQLQQPAGLDIKVIGQCVQIPFDLWAISQGVEGLKISAQESISIAVPAKTLVDYYLPQVPEIAWAWISLAAVSYSIMKPRLLMIQEIRKSKSTSGSRMDATRGNANTPSKPQGQGGPHPSESFPTLKDIKTPVT